MDRPEFQGNESSIGTGEKNALEAYRCIGTWWLYFESLDGNLTVASIREAGGSIVLESAKPLMRMPFMNGLARTIFDVDAGIGQRFFPSAAPDTTVLPLNVITNWARN